MVKPRLSRGGRGEHRGPWVVAFAVLAAMTATVFRGTNASHDWHDKPKLTPCQVTPFSSEELQGAWTEFEKSMSNRLDESTLVDHAMKNMDFRERALLTDKETLEATVGKYLAARVAEARASPSEAGGTRQATINSWLTRNEHIAQPDARRPETAPVIAVPDPRSAGKAKGRYVMPRSATSQAQKANPQLGPQGLRPQTPTKAPQRVPQPSTEPDQSPDITGDHTPHQRATEAGQGSGVDGNTSEATDHPPPHRDSAEEEGGGIDTDSEEYLNEITHLLVGSPANELVLADDSVALQFGEFLYDQDVPNCDEVLAAVCVGRGGKGPWLVSVPRFAAQVALQGNRQWPAYSKDGSEVLMTTWKADKHGNKILPERAESGERARARTDNRQKREEAKVMIIFNAPKRFVGRQHKKGQMEPLADAIKGVLKEVGGIQFGIAQGLTTELRKPRNSLNLFINPTMSDSPFDTLRGVLPQLKFLPVHETSYHVEPAVAFMPTDMLKKLNVTACCFRSAEVCGTQKDGDRCTFRTQQEQAMGYRASLFRPYREYTGGHSEYEGGERKRKREEQDAAALTKIEQAKKERLQNIIGKLCKMHREGKVMPTRTRPEHARPISRRVCRLRAVCTWGHVQQQAQRCHRTQAHQVHVSEERGGGWGRVLLHSGHMPICPAQPREGTGKRGERSDGALKRHRSATGNRNSAARRPARGQREPEPGDQRGGLGQLPRNTRGISSKESEGASVQQMRGTSGLAYRLQASGNGDQAEGGCGVQQQSLLTPVSQSRALARAAEVYRRSSERGTQAYAHARQHRGRRVAHTVRRRNRESPRAGAAAIGTLTDTHHWHTQNILWLEGRLPWHRRKRNA